MASLSESPCAENRNASENIGPKERADALRKGIDADLDRLASAVDAVRASADFQAWLDVQSRFHRYSWHNTFLILMQRPDATNVAGFNTWRKLGRFVRKGERGIMIFAPCPWKRDRVNDAGDTETDQGIFFKVVYVFDVAQTDGKELPGRIDVPTVEAVADELLARLAGVARRRKIALTFDQFNAGFFGVSKRGAIDIDNGHATGQQAKTLAHELAHEALHWDIKGPFTRNLAELEAESVAYIVCRHFGLDCEVRSARYFAVWGGDAKALRESLQRIAETARGIIDDAESDTSADDAQTVTPSVQAPIGQGVAA